MIYFMLNSLMCCFVIVGAKLEISPNLRLSLTHLRILSLANKIEISRPILRLADHKDFYSDTAKYNSKCEYKNPILRMASQFQHLDLLVILHTSYNL